MAQNELKNAFRFNVNKESGIVTCYLPMEDFLCCILFPMAEKYSVATNNCSAENAVWNMLTDERERVTSDSLYALAKCNMKEDVFDEEFGKKLAQRKLELKLARLRKRICNNAAKRLRDLSDMLSEKANKNEQYALSREDSLNSFVKQGSTK